MNDDSASATNPQLAAAVAEYFEALERWGRPDRTLFLSRYPEIAAELALFFDDHDQLLRYAGPLAVASASHSNSASATNPDVPTLAQQFRFPLATTQHIPATPQIPAGKAQQARIGPYEVLEELGHGGMGVVYRARHVELNRIVALKTILDGHFASSADRERFAAEARAAAQLDHSGIVPIFEVNSSQGFPYLAMQLVEGESLAHRLQSGPLTARQAARLLRKVAAAVAHAHQRGIIHRDLKPGNILLARSDPAAGQTSPQDGEICEPRITDFGLAKRLDETAHRTTTGQILGTPAYMAPEQAAGRVREIGVAADIYGLGAILYAMLVGHPPFRSENPVEVILQVLEREPVLPRKLNPAVPRELEWICLKCLEKKPVDRYLTALDLVADLDRFLCHEPPHAGKVSLASRLRRWVRRQPVLAVHLLSLVVPLLVTQGVLLTTPGRNLVHHFQLSILISVWMIACAVFQWLMDRRRSSRWPLYLWCAADAAFLTSLLGLLPPPFGVLTCGYLLLICMSALAGLIRLVGFTTTCSMLGYIGLYLLRPDEAPPLSYAIALLLTFGMTGLAVGYQVWRLRVLHEYWGDREL